MSRGRLIYFSGLDGSGKTTQAERVVAARVAAGESWSYRWVRWEPRLTGPLMALARFILRGGNGSERPVDDAGHTEFVAGKRAIFRRKWLRRVWTTTVLIEYIPQMAWRLLPALWSGRTVVCDRYLPDVWVDLAMNFGEGTEGVESLSRHPLSRCFPRPDHLVLLDLPARIGWERKQDGTPLAYLEEREHLYADLTRLFPSTVVDARAPLDEVARSVQDALAALD